MTSKQAEADRPDSEQVTAMWQAYGRTAEFRRAVQWSQNGEIPGALFVAFRAGLNAALTPGLPQAGETPSAEAKDAERYRKLIEASEMPFPLLALIEDPENNDRQTHYGRKKIDSIIDSYDDLPSARAALAAPAAAVPLTAANGDSNG